MRRLAAFHHGGKSFAMGITAAFMVPHPPLIIPDVGKGEERKIQHTIDAYREAARRIGELRPETILLISPHQVMYADYFHISPGKRAKGDFDQFRAGHVRMEAVYDTEFVEKLCALAEERGIPAGTQGERIRQLDHGTMVPLYFFNQFFTEYRLVRIGLSGLPLCLHYELGQCMGQAAELLGRRTVVIGSGDLSHRLKEDGPYGFRKEGPEYDARIMEVMEGADFGRLLDFSEDFCEKAGECGHRSFTIMAGALDQRKVRAERLSYEGPFGVGEKTGAGAAPPGGRLRAAGTENHRNLYPHRQDNRGSAGSPAGDVREQGRGLCFHQGKQKPSGLYRNYYGHTALHCEGNYRKRRQCLIQGSQIFPC